MQLKLIKIRENKNQITKYLLYLELTNKLIKFEKMIEEK